MNPNSPLQKFKLNVLFFTSRKQSKKVKLENIQERFFTKMSYLSTYAENRSCIWLVTPKVNHWSKTDQQPVSNVFKKQISKYEFTL